MKKAASEKSILAPFDQVLADFKAGKMVIIVDDHDRENEGDLVIATEKLTLDALNFMSREARGLICVSISVELAERLSLPLQVLNNNSPFQTPFTVSIDYKSVGQQGITAASRLLSMQKLLDPETRAADFRSPGHIFPLVANPAGVIGRQGQTEGSYDLARICGFQPSGVICEVMNHDGTMARGDQLLEFANRNQIKITSIEEIARYRAQHEILVREVAASNLNTDFGTFKTTVFEDDIDGKEHLALCYGNPSEQPGGALLRIHSECLTGDVFGSRRCDCGKQLDIAMKQIVAAGCGVVLYLRQEGRGIGLGNKLKAYALQDEGHDTVEANIKLGFAADSREYAVAANILSSLKISNVRLMTNNPEKLETLERFGVKVSERVPLHAPEDQYSKSYLETKRDKMGHLL